MDKQLQNKIDSLDIFEKLRIYMNYYCVQIGMKYDCDIEWNLEVKYKYPNGDIITIPSGLKGFNYLWQNIFIDSFQDFINPQKQIRVIDHGDNWQENGFAQKIQTDYFGIYRWFPIYESYKFTN